MSVDVSELRRIPADLEWEPNTGSQARLQVGRIAHEAADEIERLRTVLEFYAYPFGKCDQVPDDYTELDFGERAQEALNPQLWDERR